MIFTMGGIQMQMIARSYLVYDMTESAKLLGSVSAAGGLPMLILAPFGGAIADRMNRKNLIQFGQLTLAIIAISIGISIHIGEISWLQLLLAAILQGIVWPFVMPARQALIPQLVGHKNISNAVALQAAAMSLTTMTAPAIAGILYAFIGPEGVYHTISISILLSLILTSLISNPPDKNPRSKSHVLEEIWEGFSYVKKNRLLITLMAITLSTILLTVPIKFLLPIFVTDIYQRESGAFGLLMSVIGIGSLAGSIFIAWLGQWKRGLLLILGSFVSGLAILILGLIPVYSIAIGLMVLIGLGEASRRTLSMGLIMEQVDDKHQARVMSFFTMSFGLMPLGIFPAGIAIDLIGPEKTVATMGIAMLIITTIVFLRQKTIRGLQ